MATTETPPLASDDNRDPLSNEPGAHPVGAGIGAAVGGGAAGAALGALGVSTAAGAAAGSPAGPVGVVVGAIAGGVVGGLIGKDVAESVHPTSPDAYWEQNYFGRPYFDPNISFEEYRPAYRYGWEARQRFGNRPFEEIEPELERGWPTVRGRSQLDWDIARHAVRDAWEHAGRTAESESGACSSEKRSPVHCPRKDIGSGVRWHARGTPKSMQDVAKLWNSAHALRSTSGLATQTFSGANELERHPSWPAATEGRSAMLLEEFSWKNEVLQSPEPVLVDFWAPWCGPCRMMNPVIQRLAEEFKICKVNVDSNPELASHYRIASIPAILLFKDGQVAARYVGVTAEETLRGALRELSPEPAIAGSH